MNDLILIGAGGHSKVIQDIVQSTNKYYLKAILDDAFLEKKIEKGIIYAPTNYLNELDKNNYNFCIAIGDNRIRKRIYNRLRIKIENYVTLVHSTAVISPSAKIGFGTVIMPNAVINADSVIGNHCIINTSAVVEHDNRLKDYVHISPGAVLAGGVTIDIGTHIGTGANIIPGASVGSWSIVGAGAVVNKNILNNCTAVGVPAKVIK